MIKEDIFCCLCSYSSKYKSNLKRHILQKHSIYFKCKKCEFKSTSKRYLQNHMRDHEWTQTNDPYYNEFQEYIDNPIQEYIDNPLSLQLEC